MLSYLLMMLLFDTCDEPFSHFSVNKKVVMRTAKFIFLLCRRCLKLKTTQFLFDYATAPQSDWIAIDRVSFGRVQMGFIIEDIMHSCSRTNIFHASSSKYEISHHQLLSMGAPVHLFFNTSIEWRKKGVKTNRN